MQNNRPPDDLNPLLRSQPGVTFLQMLSNAALQQQAAQSRTELTGQSSSAMPFRQYQQSSPAVSISAPQSMHQKILSTGNPARGQPASYLSPHLSLTPASQQNWRPSQSSSTSTSLRLPSLTTGPSPAQSVNPDASQKPSTPQISHQAGVSSDQASATGTPQPKRPMSPSKFTIIGELLKKADEEVYDLVKNTIPNEILAELGNLETIEDDPELVDLLTDEIAVRTQYRQEFLANNSEYDQVASEVDDLKRQLQKLVEQQKIQKKNRELLNREEHEVPQTSQMPADVLIEQIAYENQLMLTASDIKRLEFKADFAEENDPDFWDIDVSSGTDTLENSLLSISQRPTCYEPCEVVNFEEERARYWPLIKSLAYVLEDFYQERKDSFEILHDKFSSHAKPWKVKQDKAERNTKKIHRDNKNREIYERTFQDIKKAREEKERTARSEKRPNAKQEAAMAKARDEEKKKVFGSAIIPPMMQNPLMMDQPRGKIIENPMSEALQSLNRFVQSWTDYEKGMYQKKFAQYGKNFAAIASCLGTKSTNDCIRYYYLTKQHVKYKQLHKMKKKKAGKQYKPTVVPTDGERMSERIRQFPFMRSNKYVECLICEKQMPVYLVPKLVKGMQVTGEFEETIKDELPICDSCNIHIRKAKAANFSKCPLAGCSLGRRRTKPNRTIPETANTLDFEKRRFIIHRRKLHPEAVKCCGSCIRKIQNDFADLATGKLDNDIKEFLKAREEKKIRKENENIPTWKNEELVKLADAVKLHGISNWYEIASTMGIPNKTPFWCFEKYKELQACGEWDKMLKFESSVDIFEQVNPAANESVQYVCDLVDSVVLKEVDDIIKVKEEVVTPADSPGVASGEESEEIPIECNYSDQFTKREADILRFEYLTMIKNFMEENPESPLVLEPELVDEEGAGESVSKENVPEAMEEDDEIQVIEVKPPPQKQGSTGGSLTQGTPRSGPTVADSFNFPSSSAGTEPSFEEQVLNFQRNQLDELLTRKPSTNVTVSNANLISADQMKQNELFFSNVANAVPLISQNHGVSSSSITPIENPATSAGGVVNFFLSESQKESKSNAPSPNGINLSVTPKITLTDIFEHGRQKSENPSVLGYLPNGLPILSLNTTTSPNAQIIHTNLVNNIDIVPDTSLVSSLFNNIPATTVITTQQPLGLKQIFKDGQPGQAVDQPSRHDTPSPAGRRSGEPERPSTADPIKRKSGVANTMLPHTHIGIKSMHIKRSYSPAILQTQDLEQGFQEASEASLYNKEPDLLVPSMDLSMITDSKPLLISPQKVAELTSLPIRSLVEDLSSPVPKSGPSMVKQEPQEQDENVEEQDVQSPKQAVFSHLRFPWESPRPPPDSSRIPMSPPERGARRGSPISDVLIHRHLNLEVERPQSHGAVPNLTSDIEQPDIDINSSQKMNDPLGLGESALSPAEDVYEYVTRINADKRKTDAEEARKRFEDAILKQDDDAVVMEGPISSDILSLDDESGTKKKKESLQERPKTIEEIVNENVAKIHQETQEKQKRNKMIGEKADFTPLAPKSIKTESSDKSSMKEQISNDHATMRQLSPKTIQTDLHESRYPPKYAKNDYQNTYNALNIITEDPTVTLGAPTTSVEDNNLLAAFEGLPPAEVKRKRRQETGDYVEPPRKKVRKTRRERDLKRRHRVGSEDSITSLSDWSTNDRKIKWMGEQISENDDDGSDISIPRTKDPFDDLRFTQILPDIVSFGSDSDIIEQDFEGEENAESIISPQYTQLSTTFAEGPVLFRSLMHHLADKDRVNSRKVRERESRHRRAKRKSGKSRKS